MKMEDYISYDPLTGALTWKKKRGRMLPGRPVGSKRADGYVTLRFNDRDYLGHRVAWYLRTGDWPKDQIDHINCDPSDNRICNLREATVGENQRNRKARRNNSCGLKGVAFEKNSNKWRADIRVNRKGKCLGRFETPEEAHEAYQQAARELHGQFARVS
jgi:hypothetical protein